MKTKDIVDIYDRLNQAKLTKMDDSAKFKVIKALRLAKKVKEEHDGYAKDAQEKLKGDGFDEMQDKARKWQEEGDNTSLTMDERIRINKFFSDYNRRVNDFMKEDDEKDVELSYEKLTEDEFKQFLSSNDFDVRTMMQMQDILM